MLAGRRARRVGQALLADEHERSVRVATRGDIGLRRGDLGQRAAEVDRRRLAGSPSFVQGTGSDSA